MMKTVKIPGLFFLCVTLFWHGTLNAEVLTDPTRPPGHRYSSLNAAGIKAAPRWVLSSTLIAPARRLATINGKTVGVGQKIGTARVVAIDPSRVALREGDKEIVVKLLPVDIKRAH